VNCFLFYLTPTALPKPLKVVYVLQTRSSSLHYLAGGHRFRSAVWCQRTAVPEVDRHHRKRRTTCCLYANATFFISFRRNVGTVRARCECSDGRRGAARCVWLEAGLCSAAATFSPGPRRCDVLDAPSGDCSEDCRLVEIVGPRGICSINNSTVGWSCPRVPSTFQLDVVPEFALPWPVALLQVPAVKQ
jgi:hypothetical protein